MTFRNHIDGIFDNALNALVYRFYIKTQPEIQMQLLSEANKSIEVYFTLNTLELKYSILQILV